MNINYICPHCNGYLSLNDCVIFSVRTAEFKVGLISLHPDLGNYTIKKHPGFEFDEGQELEFFCPICHSELDSDVHKRLARIIMIDENLNEFVVLFSRIAGEESTYKIIGETMEIFGDDSAEYIDFINLSTIF
ncbi:MAG: hypothetical protein K9G76_06900 [Bacteroidales bacterium]|nr:hypothetical protein [Bacteroidales bacterium]MCF8404294.1 hypothetical protein [Bacteroidales bacterium]